MTSFKTYLEGQVAPGGGYSLRDSTPMPNPNACQRNVKGQQPFHSTTTINKMASHDEEDVFDDEPPAIEPYAVLGIQKTATADEIKIAYRKAALKHHPGM